MDTETIHKITNLSFVICFMSHFAILLKFNKQTFVAVKYSTINSWLQKGDQKLIINAIVSDLILYIDLSHVRYYCSFLRRFSSNKISIIYLLSRDVQYTGTHKSTQHLLASCHGGDPRSRPLTESFVIAEYFTISYSTH